jgi:hypothetical protein
VALPYAQLGSVHEVTRADRSAPVPCHIASATCRSIRDYER